MSRGGNAANRSVIRFAVAAAAVLFCSSSAYPQTRMSVSPLPALGLTSPLGIPNAPVGQTGIPLGATELATPGVSPITSGAAPMIDATCVGASSAPAFAAIASPMTVAPPAMGSSTPGGSAGMGSASFDGGGMITNAPGTCAASASASPPMASSMGPGSSVGMVGIPLGSTELGGGGLSPPSVALSPNPSTSFMSAPTTVGTAPSFSPSSSLLTPQSAPPCSTAQTGVPTSVGVATVFGAPLEGRAFGLQADTGYR
jgi:hypothetical protein